MNNIKLLNLRGGNKNNHHLGLNHNRSINHQGNKNISPQNSKSISNLNKSINRKNKHHKDSMEEAGNSIGERKGQEMILKIKISKKSTDKTE